MHSKNNFYTTGQFASKAGVTLRTIRFYDKKGLLRPSYRREDGRRYYSNDDFIKLQQILLLKHLGFSLDEIRELTITGSDPHALVDSLKIQKKLMEERITQMQSIVNAIDDTSAAIEKEKKINWSRMINLVHLSSMENSLKTQYLNSSNIEARIYLHQNYSINKQGWFPWIYAHMHLKKGMHVLEVGAGSGELWKENNKKIPTDISIVVSDSSEGMVHDLERTIGSDKRFTFQTIDCQKIPYPDESFDLVIADHVLFYCNVEMALKEIHRVLKKDGVLIASTYGSKHMHEITDLVQKFNPEIHLSTNHLYEIFGLENGEKILSSYFHKIVMDHYDDRIEISEPDPLISYILSCHGNQNMLLMDHYHQFHDFVSEKVKNGFSITKDAGIFLCRK